MPVNYLKMWRMILEVVTILSCKNAGMLEWWNNALMLRNIGSQSEWTEK